jgi:hypothetical protein
MTDGLNIRKMSSPLLGASRIKRTGREGRDSQKRPFQEHFEDKNENRSDDGSASDADRPERETKGEKGKDGSALGTLHKDLGKRIDIHV